MFLFVAAHWDEVSPGARLTLVIAMLVLFHGLGIATQERFRGFATTMHALGTLSSGAAIALVGQIFNMQEHWPAAVLLWALCALAGWWLLGDEFQQTAARLLAPAWLISEWSWRAESYSGTDVFLFRMVAVIAAAYLTAFLRSRRRIVCWILFSAACAALLLATGVLSDGWRWSYYGYGHDWGFLPVGLRAVAYAVMLVAIAGAWSANRSSLIPVGAIAAMAMLEPWLHASWFDQGGPYRSYHQEPRITLYLLVAAVCVLLAWWGVREASRAVVNFAIVAFALTVMWFYFSSLMDKLGRSLGLIVLGILFLAGGWALEKTRRRLTAKIAEAHT